jgi:hypothetical protein
MEKSLFAFFDDKEKRSEKEKEKSTITMIPFVTRLLQSSASFPGSTNKESYKVSNSNIINNQKTVQHHHHSLRWNRIKTTTFPIVFNASQIQPISYSSFSSTSSTS